MLKRSPLKRIGKVGRNNLIANRKLAELWIEKQIDYCELQFDGCLGDWLLQNAHRHSRYWYRNQPEKLFDFKQVLRICQSCHNILDDTSKTTREQSEAIFKQLREDES